MKVYYTCRERGPAYRLDAELYEFADGVVELAKEDVEYILDATNKYNNAQQLIAMAIEEQTK
jgi:hypothetical protein